MTYRITVSSNPKSLLIIAVVVALPVGAIISFAALPIFLSIVLTVLGGYISYHLGKYIYNIFKSRIETNDDGLIFQMNSKETASLTWQEISHAGYCEHEREKPSAFVYSEEQDRLLTIPNEYEGFDSLIEELKEHLDMKDIQLRQTETVSDYLRDIIGIKKESEEASEEDDSESSS